MNIQDINNLISLVVGYDYTYVESVIKKYNLDKK